MSKPLKGLYAITPSLHLAPQGEDAAVSNFSTILSKIEIVLKSGTTTIQYRDKTSATTTKFENAAIIASLCHHYDANLIINDDLPLAAELEVGLHLGRGDGCLSTARKILGKDAIIGATCHGSLQYAEEATQQGASYLAFGRFFHSSTKPKALPASLDILATAKARFHLPIVAIGGINLDNAPLVINAGADMIASVDAIFNSSNISETCQHFQHFFRSKISTTSS